MIRLMSYFSKRGYIQFTAITLITIITSLAIQPKKAHALDTDCKIPNHIVCEVEDPNGFTEVRVNVDFGGQIGKKDVVQKKFPTCRTKTTVSWDPIVPNFKIFVTKCKKPSLTLGSQRQTITRPVIQKFSGNVDKKSSSVKLKPIK